MPALLGFAAIGMMAALASGDSPAAAYPEAELLTLFAATCSNVADVDGTRNGARALGWEAFEADASSILGRSIAARQGDPDAVQPTVVDRAFTFRRTLAGRELYLLLIDERYPGSERRLRSRICSIRDYRATGQIGLAAASRWAGRAPDVHLDIFGDIMAWEPGVTGASTATSLVFADDPAGPIDPGLELSSRFEDWNEARAPLPRS